jgi:hypothetical protein
VYKKVHLTLPPPPKKFFNLGPKDINPLSMGNLKLPDISQAGQSTLSQTVGELLTKMTMLRMGRAY